MRAGVPRGRVEEEEEEEEAAAAAVVVIAVDDDDNELTSAEGKEPGLTFSFGSGGALALTLAPPPSATTTPERAEAATRLETSLSSAGMMSSDESRWEKQWELPPLSPKPPPPRPPPSLEQ